MSAMLFNLSKMIVLLTKVFSRLIAENGCSQVHVINGEVSRILNQTLIFLKPLNKMHFNVLEILSGRRCLLSSQYISQNSGSASSALGHRKSSLERPANKFNFSFQLIFL